MTIKDIQDRIDHIKSIVHDDEVAHGREDKLRADFIKYVGTLENNTDVNLAQKARLVLTTNDIEFTRWYA